MLGLAFELAPLDCVSLIFSFMLWAYTFVGFSIREISADAAISSVYTGTIYRALSYKFAGF